MNSHQVLDQLFRQSAIAVRRSDWLERAPDALPPSLDFDRIEGMMLGLAIGDALGNTSESMTPAARRARFGEIRNYLPNRRAGGQRIGLPSDDTQLAFWTLEQMVTDRGFVPEHVARRFCQGHIFGIGTTVRKFISNMKAGVPWYAAGPHSAGDGALMRIAPMLIPHLRDGTEALWADTALSAMTTHNDSASIGACLAFVSMLWQLLAMDRPPVPEWWLESYVAVARELEDGTTYRSNAPAYSGYRGTLWQFVEQVVPVADAANLPAVEACDRWHSSGYLLETMPSIVYILMRHGRDPEEAVVRAVNDTWDNDTVAAIVGAAMGALHGKAALPERWIAGLAGRTAESDDGRVFELLAEARETWWQTEE